MSERATPETDASRGYALTSHYGRAEGSYLQMDKSGPFVHAEVARKLERERDEARNKMADALQEVDLRTLDYLRFREAIIATLEENRHLADGDDCTLAKLKSVVPEWK